MIQPKLLMPLIEWASQIKLLIRDSSVLARPDEVLTFEQLMVGTRLSTCMDATPAFPCIHQLPQGRASSVNLVLLGYYYVPYTIEMPVVLHVNPNAEKRTTPRVWNRNDGRVKLLLQAARDATELLDASAEEPGSSWDDLQGVPRLEGPERQRLARPVPSA